MIFKASTATELGIDTVIFQLSLSQQVTEMLVALQKNVETILDWLVSLEQPVNTEAMEIG